MADQKKGRLLLQTHPENKKNLTSILKRPMSAQCVCCIFLFAVYIVYTSLSLYVYILPLYTKVHIHNRAIVYTSSASQRSVFSIVACIYESVLCVYIHHTHTLSKKRGGSKRESIHLNHTAPISDGCVVYRLLCDILLERIGWYNNM